VRSGSADTSPRLSHDTENNCNVTHPTRLRYNRCKPGLSPRQRVWGQRHRTQRFQRLTWWRRWRLPWPGPHGNGFPGRGVHRPSFAGYGIVDGRGL